MPRGSVFVMTMQAERGAAPVGGREPRASRRGLGRRCAKCATSPSSPPLHLEQLLIGQVDLALAGAWAWHWRAREKAAERREAAAASPRGSQQRPVVGRAAGGRRRLSPSPSSAADHCGDLGRGRCSSGLRGFWRGRRKRGRQRDRVELGVAFLDHRLERRALILRDGAHRVEVERQRIEELCRCAGRWKCRCGPVERHVEPQYPMICANASPCRPPSAGLEARDARSRWRLPPGCSILTKFRSRPRSRKKATVPNEAAPMGVPWALPKSVPRCGLTRLSTGWKRFMLKCGVTGAVGIGLRQPPLVRGPPLRVVVTALPRRVEEVVALRLLLAPAPHLHRLDARVGARTRRAPPPLARSRARRRPARAPRARGDRRAPWRRPWRARDRSRVRSADASKLDP